MVRQKIFYKRLIAASVAAALVIFLVAIGIYKKPVQWTESLVAGVIYSVQEGTFAVSSGIGNFFSRYFFLVGLSDENPVLKKEIEHLQGEINRLKEKEVLANRLERLLQFKTASSLQLIAATVIGRETGPWFQTLMINKGQAEGVKVDMGVITPIGVLGKVVKVFSHHAQVLLITDKGSAIAAIVQRTRDEGIVQGLGEGKAHLKYLPSATEVKEGDRLITSGLEGSFSKGIVIGKIKKVEKLQDRFFLDIIVTPEVIFSKVEEVLIVSLPEPVLTMEPEATSTPGTLPATLPTVGVSTMSPPISTSTPVRQEGRRQ
ncbi:MAG: rod shape-determining protein MreC [Nitrospirota bacterium]